MKCWDQVKIWQPKLFSDDNWSFNFFAIKVKKNSFGLMSHSIKLSKRSWNKLCACDNKNSRKYKTPQNFCEMPFNFIKYFMSHSPFRISKMYSITSCISKFTVKVCPFSSIFKTYLTSDPDEIIRNSYGNLYDIRQCFI